MKAHYVMVGGFLGAGKTTALLRAGEHLARGGQRVGLIMNDQSDGLVDTALVRLTCRISSDQSLLENDAERVG